MKNNLMSGIASWKSAALLAIVAMVAAVAFSGVLTSTQNAEAATVTFDSGSAITAAPGDTVNIVESATFLQVSIDPSSTATGGFGVGSTSSIACPDGTVANGGTPCDVGRTTADPPGQADGSVTVALNIDEDSAEGFILINISGIGATEATKVINVSKAGQVGSVTATAALPAIAATAALGTNTTTVTAAVMNAQTKPAGINGQTVKFNVDGPAVCNAATGSQVCEVVTADYNHDGDDGTTPVVPGGATVTITSTGRPGDVTVTASVGGKESSAAITVYGPAVRITAVADESSIEVGTGSTFIVVTAFDAGDNPVSGQEYALKAPGGRVGPSEESVVVTVNADVNKNSADEDTATLNAKLGELPSCEAKAAVDAADGPPVVAAEAASTGTNSAGKCVFQVTAPANANPALTTSRGEHTVTIAGPLPAGAADVSVTISVGGPPTTIEHDAPERVEALSEHTVTVTVLDDEGVLVGTQKAEVIAIGGALAGTITSDIQATTTDGKASFSFLAPPGTGTISFLVRAGTLPQRTQELIEIAVGEAAPEGPAPTWNKPLATGTHNLVWNGADGADPADAGDNVVAIWRWTGSGWDGYFAEAGDVGLANTLTELSNGEAYWVVVQ